MGALRPEAGRWGLVRRVDPLGFVHRSLWAGAYPQLHLTPGRSMCGLPHTAPMGICRELLTDAADLLWPLTCPGCGRSGQWCLQCRPEAAISGRVVLLERRHPVVAADTYAGATAAAVRAWKLGGRRGLTAVLAGLVADAVVHLLDDGRPPALVPVPVRPGSRRKRGADLIADLAGAIAAQLPGATVAPCLRWRRVVAEQVGGTAEARRRNLCGAMLAQRPPHGGLLVVDDVLTSGATMAEAVRALRADGAGAVGGAVIAVAGPAAIR